MTVPSFVALTSLRQRAQQRSLARQWRMSGSLKAGAGLLAFMLLLSLFGTIWAGSASKQDFASILSPPGHGRHLLGTDPLGRDVLAWVAQGIRTSLEVALGVVCLSSLFGCTVGVIAGYTRGWVDAVLMRLADIQLSIPPLPLFIAASAVVVNSLPSLIILVSVVGWVPYARLTRARALTQRERGYVMAARLAGRRNPAIIFLHILPGVRTEVIVLASLQAGVALLWEAGLSFLGLGLQPPYVSLGFLMSEGKEVLAQAWWVATFPGIALALLVVAFNLTGDGLRDFFSNDISSGN
ncbi:MAG TPA: ABC transporter permease [Acidimicrobiales bacterium]|nr:ABC transporter permease [Acidimicrobiales bacterium]